jgi:hypothetical protein
LSRQVPVRIQIWGRSQQYGWLRRNRGCAAVRQASVFGGCSCVAIMTAPTVPPNFGKVQALARLHRAHFGLSLLPRKMPRLCTSCFPPTQHSRTCERRARILSTAQQPLEILARKPLDEQHGGTWWWYVLSLQAVHRANIRTGRGGQKGMLLPFGSLADSIFSNSEQSSCPPSTISSSFCSSARPS